MAVRFDGEQADDAALLSERGLCRPLALASWSVQPGGGAAAGREELELRRGTRFGRRWWVPTHRACAALCEPPPCDGLRASTGEPEAERLVTSVIDVSTAFGADRSCRAAGRETFARFTALDLRSRHPRGAFRPVLWRARGTIGRRVQDRGHALRRPRSGNVWTVVADAAGHSGGPGGSTPLRSMTAVTEGPAHGDIFRPGACGAARRAQGLLMNVVITSAGSHGWPPPTTCARPRHQDVALLRRTTSARAAVATPHPRSNYKTVVGREVLRRVAQALRGLGSELNFNLLFSQNGHLTWLHTIARCS